MSTRRDLEASAAHRKSVKCYSGLTLKRGFFWCDCPPSLTSSLLIGFRLEIPCWIIILAADSNKMINRIKSDNYNSNFLAEPKFLYHFRAKDVVFKTCIIHIF